MRVGVRADPRLHLVERRGAREVDLERVRAEPHVVVRVDEPGQHGARRRRRSPRCRGPCARTRRVVADPRDPALDDSDRFRPRTAGVDGVHASVPDEERTGHVGSLVRFARPGRRARGVAQGGAGRPREQPRRARPPRAPRSSRPMPIRCTPLDALDRCDLPHHLDREVEADRARRPRPRPRAHRSIAAGTRTPGSFSSMNRAPLRAREAARRPTEHRRSFEDPVGLGALSAQAASASTS